MLKLRRPTESASSKKDNESLSSSVHDGKKSREPQNACCKVFLLLCCIIVAGIASSQTTVLVTFPPSSSIEDDKTAATSMYANCTVSFVAPPPRKQSDWRKPLWVPSLPASGSASPSRKGDIVKSMIDSMTGLTSKNYHMSMRGGKLKRCYGVSETPACSQGHPYVPVGPEDQTDAFQSDVIFVIRNFATEFPAGLTDKNMAYHGATGQATEHQWRKVRDEYFTQALQNWREMIQWWRKADYYRVALYLPFEHLLTPKKGPTLVQELANVYERAGFDVASSADIPCIWYQAVSGEWKRQKKLTEYVPGYTQAQKDTMIHELRAQIEESKDDPNLVAILEDYLHDVIENTKLDLAAIDSTTKE
eukprot:Nitzschia sp. Nitz4//scaffold10_size219509//51969//53054//NITZ4_001409-RA/size219509-processed-gene-0.225-mRNA-1//1//CDS//3329532863//8638//frame0